MLAGWNGIEFCAGWGEGGRQELKQKDCEQILVRGMKTVRINNLKEG
jgi:hypothetical protein